MGLEVSTTVPQCTQCVKERISPREHTNFLKVLTSSRPLEFVSIEILGASPRSFLGYRYLLVMTDRYSNMRQKSELRTITAQAVAPDLCKRLAFYYGLPKLFLSASGRQLTSRFFRSVCLILEIRNLFTTAYHPQTTPQVERLHRAVLSGILPYGGKHGKHWDRFSSEPTYG